MYFPRFWARGRAGAFGAWRWSDKSVAEAQAAADEAARQLAEQFEAGGLPPKDGGYYPNRPFREEVLQEIAAEDGTIAAVITRNSYGCQVLNTAQVMFVDIDIPEMEGGLLKRLFGKAGPAARSRAEQELVLRTEEWTRADPGWGWRVYRTFGGLRLMATQGLVRADSDETKAVFEALSADPLYQTLCRTQKCFRARLTPKPWRCGIRTKPDRWPWLDDKARKRFERWETQYTSFSFNWATCHFVKQIGNPSVPPALQSIVLLHDAATKAESKLKLA